MSSVSIWTRGFCIIIFSCKHLRALGLIPLCAPKAWRYLQRNALSFSPWGCYSLPGAPVYWIGMIKVVLFLVISAWFYLYLFPTVIPSTKRTSPLQLQGNGFSLKTWKRNKRGFVHQQCRMPLRKICHIASDFSHTCVTPLLIKVSLHTIQRYCEVGT